MLLILSGVLDHTLPLRDACEEGGIGLLLILLSIGALIVRTWWYRTRGIYISWRCFNEAIVAAIGRPPLSFEEVKALGTYSLERQVPGAPLDNLYHVARSRRHESPEAEDEFRRVADLLYRLYANVHQVSQHTILTRYRPQDYRLGAAFGWLWTLCGVTVLGFGVLAGGVAPPTRLILAAAGAWGASVGVGLARRWHWALLQGVLFLILVEAASVYTALTPRADELAGFIVPGMYIPPLIGFYLYRRRHWFLRR